MEHTLDANRQDSVLTAVLGTVPWLLLTLPVSLGPHLSSSFARSFPQGSEGDYQRLLDNRRESLGLIVVPMLLIAATIALLCWLYAKRKRMATRPSSGGKTMPGMMDIPVLAVDSSDPRE